MKAAFARLLGAEPEELVGVHAGSLAAPDQADPSPVDPQHHLRCQGAVERDYLHRDGRRVPVLTSATRLRDGDGDGERLAGFVVDLTELHDQRAELKAALEEVARRRVFFEAVLETVDVGIVYVDADGTNLQRNRAERQMASMRGAETGDLASARPIDLLDADGRLVAPEDYPLARALRGEEPEPFRGRLGPCGGPHRDVVIRTNRIVGPHPDGSDTLLGAVVAINDVTTESAALADLDGQRRALAEAQRVGRLGSFSVDPTSGLWSMSDQLYALWGHPVDRPSVEELQEQVLDESCPGLCAALDAALLAGGRHQMTFPVRHAVTGEERIIVSTTEITRGPDAAVIAITGTHHDVTDVTQAEREANEARAFFEAVLVATPDFTCILDLATGAVVYGTPGKALLGRPSEELLTMSLGTLTGLRHPHDRARVETADRERARLADGEVATTQYRARQTDGSWRWLARRDTPFLRDDHGRVLQVLSVLRDVTDLVDAEQRLAHSALHDTLTGLPNRRLLVERLDEALARRLDTRRDVAVIFIDLDGFKRINDAFGHAEGDEVLKTTAARIAAVLRPTDTVARVGGDEFVVVIEAPDRVGTSAQDAFATEVATRIVAALVAPVDVSGRRHGVTASLGIRCVRAVGGDDADTGEQVLRDADAAMYDAKAHGKDGFVLYQPGLRLDLEKHRRVEEQLRTALDHHGPVAPQHRPGHPVPRLFPVFQPVFTATGRLVSFEALCRLTDTDGAPVRPDAFIGIAEQTGLVRRLGAYVLDAACGQLARWRADPGNLFVDQTVTMAVNISAIEAQEPGFAHRVRTVLERHGLVGRDLVLELTETSLLQADGSTLDGLRGLRADGVGIAIDDFGTGYASLRYLVTLPVSAVKVDQSFTSGVPHDRSKTRIVHAVAVLAADLGLDCVIEGVETQAQRAALPGSAQLQGYLLGRPAPAEAVALAV